MSAHVIAAISTPLAPSAVGLVRVTGDGAHDVANRVFIPLNGNALSAAEPRTLVAGRVLNAEGFVIDRALAAVMRAPMSYTGEDMAEIYCHGSPVVLTAALEALFAAGARPAERGEFTRRAFLNGLIDLTQAEAVSDLLDAETENAAISAARQLGGSVGRLFREVYDGLIEISSHFYAAVDYPDEGIDGPVSAQIMRALSDASDKLLALARTFERGRVLREGVRCAVIGRPNVGKSSLLNMLAGAPRAIVTDIPGTTRDLVTERVLLAGIMLRLTDTAGIRDGADGVEQIGIARALEASREAELTITVLDGSAPLSEDDVKIIEAPRSGRTIIAVNKSDLPRAMDISALPRLPRVFVSAKNGEGADALEREIASMFGEGTVHAGGETLTNARHAEAALRASEALREAAAALDLSEDAALSCVERASGYIAEVLGTVVSDDIVDNIFSRFCVGK